MKTVLLFALISSLVCAVVCADEVLVNDVTAHEQSMPVMGVSGDTVFVLYQDTSAYQYDVVLSTSRDGGATFDPGVLVHPPSDQTQWQPHMAVSETSAAYIVWADYRSSEDFDVYLTVTTDGAEFSDPVRLNDHVAGTQIEPRVMVSPSGDIFATWHDNRDTTSADYGIRWDVYVAKSTDQGETFGPSMKLSGEDFTGEEYFALYPQIAAGDEDTVHMVWWQTNWGLGDQKLRYVYSDDGGDTFSAPHTLVSGSYHFRHRLAADETGRVALVWEDGRDSASGIDPDLVFGSGRCLDVFGKFSNDNGQTWSADFRINDEVMLNQQRPSVILTDGGWAVAWSDDRDVGDYTIRLVTQSWPPDMSSMQGQKIDDYLLHTERTFPALAAAPDALMTVWQDYRDTDYDIYFKQIEEPRHE